MHPERMSPEELRKAEAERVKSDSDLIDTGAKYSDRNAENGPRLEVDSRTQEVLHEQGEKSLDTIKRLESKEYNQDLVKFKEDCLKGKTVYHKVREALEIDKNALNDFADDIRDGKQPDIGHVTEIIRLRNIQPSDWQTARQLVKDAQDLAHKYGLRISVLQHMDRDEILIGLPALSLVEVIEQARAATLYEAKQLLGKVS